jgi:hypothetical protein
MIAVDTGPLVALFDPKDICFGIDGSLSLVRAFELMEVYADLPPAVAQRYETCIAVLDQ